MHRRLPDFRSYLATWVVSGGWSVCSFGIGRRVRSRHASGNQSIN